MSETESGGGDSRRSQSWKAKQCYYCDICMMKFSLKANMRRHRLRHSGVRPYECQECHKRYFRRDQLKEHMITHLRPCDCIECPVCSQIFSGFDAVKTHLYGVHGKDDSDKSKVCRMCQYQFSSIRGLLIHCQSKHWIGLGESSPNQTDTHSGQDDQNTSQSTSVGQRFGQSSTVGSSAVYLQSSDGQMLRCCTLLGDVPQPCCQGRVNGNHEHDVSTPREMVSGDEVSNVQILNERAVTAGEMDSDGQGGHGNQQRAVSDREYSPSCFNESTGRAFTKVLEVKTELDDHISDVNDASNRRVSCISKPNDSYHVSAAASSSTHQPCLSNPVSFIPQGGGARYEGTGDLADPINVPDVSKKNDVEALSLVAPSVSSTRFQSSKGGWTKLKQLFESSSTSSNSRVHHSAASASHVGIATSINQSRGSDVNYPAMSVNRQAQQSNNSDDSASQISVGSSSAQSASSPSAREERRDYLERPQRGSRDFGQRVRNSSEDSNLHRDLFECQPCGILFRDHAVYLLHKGTHTEGNQWRCNLCGFDCGDKYQFHAHIISRSHF